MQKAEGNVGVIGWGTMPDDNEFLEMRVACGGTMVPSGLDPALPVGTLGLSLPSRLALTRRHEVTALVGDDDGGRQTKKQQSSWTTLPREGVMRSPRASGFSSPPSLSVTS